MLGADTHSVSLSLVLKEYIPGNSLMSVCFKYNSSNNPSIFLGKYVHSDILIYFLIRTKYCYGRQKVFCIRCIGLQTRQAYAILGYVIVCSVDMDAGTSGHACLRSK